MRTELYVGTLTSADVIEQKDVDEFREHYRRTYEYAVEETLKACSQAVSAADDADWTYLKRCGERLVMLAEDGDETLKRLELLKELAK